MSLPKCSYNCLSFLSHMQIAMGYLKVFWIFGSSKSHLELVLLKSFYACRMLLLVIMVSSSLLFLRIDVDASPVIS